MMLPFAVVLLLGAASVLGKVPSCDNIQNSLMQELELNPGASADIKATNFGNRVQVQRSEDSKSQNTFIVKKSQDVPKVTVDGQTYELHSCSVVPLAAEGTVSFEATFSPEGSDSSENGVSIFAPLLPIQNYDAEVNENLNEDLDAMGSSSSNDINDLTIWWLEDFLPKATIMEAESSQKMYLVPCEKIYDDAIVAFV